MVAEELCESSSQVTVNDIPPVSKSMEDLHHSDPITRFWLQDKVYARLLGSTSKGFQYFMERFYWLESQVRIHVRLQRDGRPEHEKSMIQEYEELFRVQVIRKPDTEVLERVDVVANFGQVDEEIEFLLWNDLIDCWLKLR